MDGVVGQLFDRGRYRDHDQALPALHLRNAYQLKLGKSAGVGLCSASSSKRRASGPFGALPWDAAQINLLDPATPR
jgi:hypothetical protein